MVNHARALVLRDRNHPAVIRWSQSQRAEPAAAIDSEQFEQGPVRGDERQRRHPADQRRRGRRRDSANQYPNMTYANFDVFAHYLDGFGHYGEKAVVA